MDKIEWDEELINALRKMWDYMVLDMPLEKADLIIGCGCKSLAIPKRCAELYKKGYGENVLFCGGFGKMTGNFAKPESEIYREIAIKEGVPANKIYIENQSTNTGDNFRFGLEVIKENGLKYEKILIVHNKLSERRTLSAAKAIIPEKEIRITGPENTFSNFIENVKKREVDDARKNISVIVGDLQRIIIFPQFGWQIENEVTEEVKQAYFTLKNKGFNLYIFDEKQIQSMIEQNGLKEGMKENYFH